MAAACPSPGAPPPSEPDAGASLPAPAPWTLEAIFAGERYVVPQPENCAVPVADVEA